MKVLAAFIMVSVFIASCGTKTAAPLVKEKSPEIIQPVVDLEPKIKQSEIIEPEPIFEKTEKPLVTPTTIKQKAEIVDLATSDLPKEISQKVKIERNTNEPTLTPYIKTKNTVVFDNNTVLINNVEYVLETAFLQNMDKTTNEAKVLNKMAVDENEYFKSNIYFTAKDISKKLKGKYEYRLFIKNNNRLLTLENIELKV
ncbi:MAG: hypothetical protein ACPGLV_00280, partial [Bacteroidia bacterium]